MDNLTKLLTFLQKTGYNISWYENGCIEISEYCVPENYTIRIFGTIDELINYLDTDPQF
jgi:hypothetical protein